MLHYECNLISPFLLRTQSSENTAVFGFRGHYFCKKKKTNKLKTGVWKHFY
jgi:hypothetical protein